MQLVFSPQQETAVEPLLRPFTQAGIDSPSDKESQATVGEVVFAALIELGCKPVANTPSPSANTWTSSALPTAWG